MSNLFHSGKYSTAFCGTATANHELPMVSWSVNASNSQQQFRNSKTGAFTNRESSFHDCTFSISIDRDFNENPFQAANGGVDLISGQTNAVTLYHNKNAANSNTVNWNFPSAVLENVSEGVSIEGKPVLNYNFGSNGPFTEPSY